MTQSWLWFTLLFSTCVAYLVRQIVISEYTLWENCLYGPTYLMGRLFWRVTFLNSAPPELRNGAVLVANHRSSVDPFFVQLAARRRVHWMVAKEYCNHAVFGPILRACQVIPTNRSGMDTASTKAAIRITHEGRLVGMFPEGKINQTSQLLLPLRSGAAVVANKANVPIVPLLIQGSPFRKTVWSPLLMAANVRITFGEPIAYDTRPEEENIKKPLADSDHTILQWGKEIARLAGQPDFEVTLASARTRRRRGALAR